MKCVREFLKNMLFFLSLGTFLNLIVPVSNNELLCDVII